MRAAEDKVFTIEEYFQLEENSNQKHEYHDGEIVDMSGGSISHNIISGNAYHSIRLSLEEANKECLPFNSDQKIYIEQVNHFVYADTSIVCGEIESSKHDNQAIINPILIVEVLSESTSGYDRGEKFHKYCSLPSFKEYLLIDQNQPVVDTLFREEKNYWRMVTTIGLDKSISLHSLGIEIKMADLYKNIQDLKDPQFTLDF